MGLRHGLRMLAFAFLISTTVGCTPPESIEIRKFSLTTGSGQNILHEKFDQNAFREISDRLDLDFHAIGKQFKFELQRISVFGPNAIVRTIGNVRGYKMCYFYTSNLHTPSCVCHFCCCYFFYQISMCHFFLIYTFYPKGKEDLAAPLPDILTFSSAESDAAITFINSTSVNGVVSQHGKAFDIVASADLLVVINLSVFLS